MPGPTETEFFERADMTARSSVQARRTRPRTSHGTASRRWWTARSGSSPTPW